MSPGTQNQEVVARYGNEPVANLVCIIRDETNPEWRKSKFHHNFSCNTTITSFFDVVAEKSQYKRGTFHVAYMKPCVDGKGDQEILLHDGSEKTLTSLVGDHPGKRVHFTIKQKDGLDPVRTSEEKESGSVTGPPDDSLESLFQTDSPLYSYAPLPSSNTSSENQLTPFRVGGFVGLINQAMTCYLNSLIQTLFMTPEFRNALYRWKYEGTTEEGLKSIPYQLQRLFLRLQTSTKQSVETTDLTKSFGWDSSEAWQQHDVQELCRAMFDALEEALKNTDEENLINHLYQGKVKDYVRCLKCGHESARVDTYLDIPLAVRPFESKEAFASAEEALGAYVTAETLEGNNQYFCEQCSSKQDAKKGLKFLSFPCLLTLQLKRFTFDYNSLQRIKLHDRVTFPDTLDLSGFLEDVSSYDEKPELSLAENGELDEIEKKKSSSLPRGNLVNGCANETGIKRKDNGCEVNHRYELFSIMIHSGSAVGGHYYAYIKSFTDAQWYCFNDHSVTTISRDDIEKTYGGLDRNCRGYYSSTYSSSTNAYMLMYRKIDPTRNAVFMDKSEWPMHIQDLADGLRQDEESEQSRKERDRNTCKIRVFCNNPKDNKMVNVKLEIHKDKTLQETTEKAWKLFGLQDIVPLSQCRLIKYDDFYTSYERSFEGEEDVSIEKILGGVRYSYTFDLLLETRNVNESFPVYEAGGSTVKVHQVNLATGEVNGPHIVHAMLNQTVKEFKSLLEEKLGYSAATLRLAVGKEYNEFRLLDNPQKTLKAEGFYKSTKVYAEYAGGEDFDCKFVNSEFLKALDKFIHTIRLFVVLPYSDSSTSELKELPVKVDKRITLEQFKKIIEPDVGVDSDLFRVYRVYSNNQEIESTKLTDQMTSYSDDMKVVIKLGRALKKGESRVKVYLLNANKDEHTRFLLETVVSKGMTIRSLKEQIAPELEKVHGISAPLERLRLRKKAYKNPARIYVDNYVFDSDIVVSFGMELFLEILERMDPVTSADLITVYTKRWLPSKHELCPFEEVVLKEATVMELKKKLAEKTGLSPEDIEIAKGRSFFPNEISVLNVHTDLEWNPKVTRLREYPLSITDDGAVLFYRDKREPLQDLTEDKRKEIKDKEKKKLQKSSSSTGYAVRKEKALKIYTNASKK